MTQCRWTWTYGVRILYSELLQVAGRPIFRSIIRFAMITRGVVTVRAFLDGAIRVEADSEHLTTTVYRFLGLILDRHRMPYERERTTENRKTPSTLSTIFGSAVETLVLYWFLKIFGTVVQEKWQKTPAILIKVHFDDLVYILNSWPPPTPKAPSSVFMDTQKNFG